MNIHTLLTSTSKPQSIKDVLKKKGSTQDDAFKLIVFIVDQDDTFAVKVKKLIQEAIELSQIKDEQVAVETYSFTSGEECIQHMNLQPDLIIFEFFISQRNSRYLNGGEIMDEILEANPNQNLIMTSRNLEPELIFKQIDKGLKTFLDKKEFVNTKLANVIDSMYSK